MTRRTDLFKSGWSKLKGAPAPESPGGTTAFTVSPVTDERLSWSPYTWFDEEGPTRFSPTVGAYLDVAFRGTDVGLRIDTPVGYAKPMSIMVSAMIDGGEPVRRTIDEADESGAIIWDSLSLGDHTVRFTVALNVPMAGRWFGDPVRALRITGVLTRGPLRSLVDTPLEPSPIRSIFYGDSITEGNYVGETYGDESFAVVALRILGHHYALKGYTAMPWQHSLISETDDFVYPAGHPDERLAVWRNAYSGQSLLTNDAEPTFLDGCPDVVFNNVGTNDTANAFVGNRGAPPSTEYLPGAVSAWLTQIRAATSPDTVVVMVMPVVYGCPEAAPGQTPEAMAAVRQAYLDGIDDYRKRNPDDEHVITLDLGDDAAKIHLAHPRETIHPGPTGARLIGELVAERIAPHLAHLDGATTTESTKRA